MNEPIFVVVTIAENGVIHAWGPYDTPHDARKQVNRFRSDDRRYQREGDVRYAVCKLLDGEPEWLGPTA